MEGELDRKMLDAVLETLPVELSVVDKNDNVLAWNKHETRLFKRPRGVIGRNVRDCHPRKSLFMVEKILQEMQSGIRDRAQFWIDMPSDDESGTQKILIEYYALRDENNNYLGCLESSQNITEIQKITGEKRLL